MKNRNIKDDTIVFVREKTKRSNSVANKEIRAYLHPEIVRIIETWGRKSNNPDDFIFPILDGYDTIAQKELRRKKVQKQVNQKLKEIGTELGFTTPLILNLARHSFATNLKLSGTPTLFISEALGHASVTTSQFYLKSIPDQKIKELSNSVLNFETED